MAMMIASTDPMKYVVCNCSYFPISWFCLIIIIIIIIYRFLERHKSLGYRGAMMTDGCWLCKV